MKLNQTQTNDLFLFLSILVNSLPHPSKLDNSTPLSPEGYQKLWELRELVGKNTSR